MNYIFAPGPQIRYWLGETGQDFVFVDDLDVWQTQPGRRVAAFELLGLDPDIEAQIQHCCDRADLVILFVTEFIDDAWVRRFDLTNVALFLNGRLNWQTQRARCYQSMYFFWSTCDFYRAFPTLLENLEGSKHLMFDALLGRRKPHRDRISQNLDATQNVITYFPRQEQDIRQYDASQFVWPTEVLPQPDTPIDYTVQEVQVNGVIVSLSQIIPREIYQRTRYSLVAETETNNGWSFFTEKITKPILARRLFLVASGQYYLANLRSMGFQTFRGIIDESYDLEPDLDQRITMIMEQAKYLASMPYEDVQQQILPIVEHNYSVMMDTDWQGSMIKDLAGILSK
jgi:hypothetical protein